MSTSIEWTDATWNPIVGCTRVSPGCEHCYAERFVHRQLRPEHVGLTVMRNHGPGWIGEVRLLPERLAAPQSWKKGRKVFVNSLSDVFHEKLRHEYRAAVLGAMLLAPQHTYQILTKRPEVAVEFERWLMRWAHREELSPIALCLISYFSARGIAMTDEQHALVHGIVTGPDRRRWWIGVTAEDQQRADERIPLLLTLKLPTLHFVSYEPALGPLRFRNEWLGCRRCGGEGSVSVPGGGTACPACFEWAQGSPSRGPHLDWIIVGGESGPGARPFDVAWMASTIAQCRAAKVAVFCKQLGAHVVTRNDDNFTIEEDPPDPAFPGWPLHLEAEDRVEHDLTSRYQGAPVRVRLRDRKGGDWSEWRSDLRVREFPPARVDDPPIHARDLCGKYLGDNDATNPQLTCVRTRGHEGLCDNVRGDEEVSRGA